MRQIAKSAQNISKVGQAHKKNYDSMKKAGEVPWWEHMNRSKKSVVAHSLKDIIKCGPTGERDMMKFVERKAPIIITNNLCRTAPGYVMSNLPKVNDWKCEDLNFAFGANITEDSANVEKMLGAEKVALCYFAHEYKNNYGVKQQILRIYAIAPEFVGTDLPYIYRVDILSTPEDKDFYAIRGSAVIGGCIDGGCKIFEMGVADDDSARLYRFKSGNTYKAVDYEDDVDNARYRVTEVGNIKNLGDAADYAFSLLNINSRRNVWSANEKLEDIAKTLTKTDATVKITGSEMVETIIEHGVYDNSKKVYQQVNEGGKLRGTVHSGGQHGGGKYQGGRKY